MFTFRVADRFGDSGLTGVLGLSADGDRMLVEDFVLSCRVFGKQIEEVMLAQASARAGDRRLVLEYQETAKNKPCRDFLLKGYLDNEDPVFTRDGTRGFPFPGHIEVVQG